MDNGKWKMIVWLRHGFEIEALPLEMNQKASFLRRNVVFCTFLYGEAIILNPCRKAYQNFPFSIFHFQFCLKEIVKSEVAGITSTGGGHTLW